jgi:ADP-ribose pyrophosphatase YjhB (NUDIX family)
VVAERYDRVMIRPNRPTYLYDLNESKCYRMRTILPSFCSYDGTPALLQKLSEENSEYYVLAPMYATKLVKRKDSDSRSSSFKNESNAKTKPRLIPSLNNPSEYNAGDVQPLIGGKLKIGENKVDGVIREIEEETGLVFEEKEVIEDSNVKNDKECLTICFRGSIDAAKTVKKEVVDLKDEERSVPTDDSKRKVCISIYGTAVDIVEKLNKIPQIELDDNIIALAIIPIEVAIQIDEYAVRFWKRRNEQTILRNRQGKRRIPNGSRAPIGRRERGGCSRYQTGMSIRTE